MTIEDYADRVKVPSILYVDVYPFVETTNEGKIEFLIFERNDGIPLANTWQPVCGKIIRDESFREAFIRQVKQKTGQFPEEMWKLDLVNTYYDEYYDTIMLVPAAFCRLKNKNVSIDFSLHRNYKWITCEEKDNWLIWPRHCECIERIQGLLSKKNNRLLEKLKLRVKKEK